MTSPFAVVVASLLAVLPVLALVVLLLRVVPGTPAWIRKRRVWGTASAVLLVYAGVFLYGWKGESDFVEVTRTEIRVDRPILGYKRFRILHLSDLHMEELGTRERRIVEAARRERPHLIVLTGDYVNRRGGGELLVRLLRRLHAPYGVYGVSGDWDRKWPVREFFRAAGGCEYLEDRRAIVREGKELLCVVGQDVHPGRSLAELLEGSPEGTPILFLAHSPDRATELAGLPPSRRVTLFLCGHTHGGQVRLPLLGGIWPGASDTQGRTEAYGTPIYVSRGVGTWGGGLPSVRLFCRPEIAVIDLVAP